MAKKKVTPKIKTFVQDSKVEKEVIEEVVEPQIAPEVQAQIEHMEQEFKSKIADKYSNNLPKDHEFKQIGKKSYLICQNRKISRDGNLEDNKEYLARIFLFNK